MTMPAMLAAMMGGAGGFSLNIPCAHCLANPLEGLEPANGVTLVAGTLVCADHAPDALAAIDHGHIADAVGKIGDVLGRLVDITDDLARRT